MTAPTAKERKACWDARDLYWQCMDSNNEDISKCEKLRHCFESNCPQQWVKHFEKRRDYLKFKEKLESGEYQPSKNTEQS
ncbi:cytochrome c oxidase assembly factor 6 homolog [Bombina bombina]|uniref:cytochrome c oxidase assembly factor 6 homolog n=1 Tax=Bombina bombina TaxID=8345 RepID=UPI00235A764E|nr:cytochrome c oxidase assembly factor 6 homolog [Bombina bombina]